ncbi:hypothetical protein A3840_01020 [Devosia elaeis]|uniref:Uncharacterized protein n=2 Tax=Devosia elaeis TaxID=1770058 RepID=A0A178I6Z0_9HYPH|nr:hypothetical protein A3840_01020 [Devosia elaeis]
MAGGISPVEYMLGIMRDSEADAKERAWAAEKVAPFVHPRPAPMERTVQIDLPDTSTPAGIDKALDAIIASMSKGELSPSEGQSFISVIEARRKAIEANDLLARIEALETQHQNKKG